MTPKQSMLSEILTALKVKEQLPLRIDFTNMNGRFWCVVSDESNPDSSIMSEKVFTGMSFDKDTALLKALSERAERYAFLDGASQRVSSCATERSDGFAALPKALMGVLNVRDFALNEAIERFVWATWWDNDDIDFEIRPWNTFEFSDEHRKFVSTALSSMNIQQLQVVLPKMTNDFGRQVIVLVGGLNGRGFVSGGACGLNENFKNTFFRALDELSRHALAIQRTTSQPLAASMSFYEKRLLLFGNGKGDQLVWMRLNRRGNKKILLPELLIDETVPTKFSDFIVYRCYFVGQPPFVGGELERLCL